MAEKPRTPNDQSSDVHNPNNQPPHINNDEYKAKIDNRSRQKNPQDQKFQGGQPKKK